jgi:hypothetical protein
MLFAKFGSFGDAVSEVKIFRNQPIRDKERLWRHVFYRIWTK